MIKTIFFDFGNVVAFFDHGRAVKRLLSFTDLTVAEVGPTLRPAAGHDYEIGKITTAEFVREATRHGRLTCTPEEFLACFCDIFWRNHEVCDLIPRLKPRYRVVLASNTVDAHFRRYVADYADILANFNHLVASHHAGARKPHPDFFVYAQQFALAEAHECLLIDDLAANVESATRLGWKGIVYAPDGTLADKLKAAGVDLASGAA